MSDDRNLKTLVKAALYVGGTALVGYGGYQLYKYCKNKYSRSVDEGFEDATKLEDSYIRKILVLGLESSGKSSLVSKLTQVKHVIKPTEGFNVTPMEVAEIVYNFWEIGGKDKVRKFWLNFLQDTDLLMYVIDSSDIHSLPITIKELKTLVGDERLKNVPVLVIASKCDTPGALTVRDVTDAIDVKSIESYKHKVKVLGDTNPSPEVDAIERIRQTIIALVKSPSK
ncbi:ADP-ribosylation factor-like protein 2 [Chrysoperla carnea]|uniref:ADP-ribosylation factor-like protein 2 n=1 Tax=Chrysoperla carnea TaxID=189513 RepID=UPI001D0628D7|nr:ADP-ribosylation factor-like protein 2 [Chrysoperla carnea]